MSEEAARLRQRALAIVEKGGLEHATAVEEASGGIQFTIGYIYRTCPVQTFGHTGTNPGHAAGLDLR